MIVVGGGQVELGEDVGDVLLDRAGRDDERARDGGVGPALGHQAEHLALARGERAERPVVRRRPRPRTSSATTSRSSAVPPPATRSHGVDERLHVPHALLEQVADPALAGVEQLGGVDRLDVLGEDQDAEARDGARAPRSPRACPRR